MSSHHARRIYVADFETIVNPEHTRIWAWGMAPIDNHYHFEYDTTMESFIERIMKADSVVYFHNLRFDATFIIDHILKDGYCHTTDRTIGAGQFATLISHKNQFFNMKVTWRNGKKTEFRDSLKKLPMSVAKIAKAFKLDVRKGELDYHKDRPIGHILTDYEVDYLQNDVQIVCQAMHEVISSGMTKLTVGADSLAEYKSMMGKSFDRYFPVLSKLIDDQIRDAYRGGFTYADERFKGRVLGGGVVLDINSLYPAVMYNELLPFDEPIFINGQVLPTESHPLAIFSVTFVGKLKKNHIPCINKKSQMFNLPEYLKVIKEPLTLTVTNVDWELFNKHYDIKVISWNDGWRFRARRGLFKEYIDKWMTEKINSPKGGRREIAKLHLTSLYGKFATNPDVTGKIPILEDNMVKLVRGPEETRSPVYTAMGVFVTAYARTITITAAQANYDTFAYADTDSLHLITNKLPDDLDIDPSRLGAWKKEYWFDKAIYARPKAYMEQSVDYECDHNEEPDESHGEHCKVVTHIAGITVKRQQELTFDDIYDGHIIEGKTMQKTVPGGVYIKDTTYTLKFG